MSPECLENIERAQSGDLAAQDALIRDWQARVAGFVMALTGNSSMVEDLSQTVFLKVLLGLPGLRDPERFEAWLFRLARNVCRDHFRRERWRAIFVPFAAGHEEVLTAPPSAPTILEEFLAALQTLPPVQRELLVLKQERDWTYEELAAITGTTVSSVKSRLFRARAELKRILSHED